MKVIELSHRNKAWYAIKIDIKDTRIDKIKKIEGRTWSSSNKMWLIPKSDENKQFLISISNTSALICKFLSL